MEWFVLIIFIVPAILGAILCSSIAKHKAWSKWIRLVVCILVLGITILATAHLGWMIEVWLNAWWLDTLFHNILSRGIPVASMAISLSTVRIVVRVLSPLVIIVSFSIAVGGLTSRNPNATARAKREMTIVVLILCAVTALAYWHLLGFINDLINNRSMYPWDYII